MLEEDKRLKSILQSKIENAGHVADRLSYSIVKSKLIGIDHLDKDRLKSLSDDEMEVIDAYLYRYGSLASSIQDSIFKSIADIESEEVSKMSNRDKTNLMERLGLLPSAEDFSSIVTLRNKLMHDYLEEAQKIIDRMNLVMQKSQDLVESFVSVARYAIKFGIEINLSNFTHLSKIQHIDSDVCQSCSMVPCGCPRG